MPGKDLPINNSSMVNGLGYVGYPVPDNDACSTAGTDQNGVMGAPASMAAPLQPVSLATETVDAPGLGARQTTTLHQEGWLNYDEPHFGSPDR